MRFHCFACVNCPIRKSTVLYWSTSYPDTESELGLTICEVCSRRNSSISEFWCVISAIRELLIFNHCPFSEKACLSIFFPDFLAIFSHFIGFYWLMCLELPFWEKSTVPCLSTSTETLYLSNVWLESINCEVCSRRNSSISGFWWAISAITELLLLLLLNYWASFLALCENLI